MDDIAAAPLRALFVDDSATDTELIVRTLARQGYALDWKRVWDAEGLERELAAGAWDVVLCDYSMPGFGGLEALAIVRRSGIDLPFLLVSGTVGEENAVAAMRAGAHDYLLKDQLARLGPAIARERAEAEERRQRRHAEAALRLRTSALEAAVDTILITDRDGTIEWANPAFTALTGYALEEARGRNPRDLVRSGVHPREFFQDLWDTILAGRPWQGEMVNRRKDGSLYAEEETITPVRGEDGAIRHFIAVKRDVTERHHAEAERKRLEARLRQSQKLEAIGRLAGGVAHDFNNALGVVLGRSETALRKVAPDSAAARDLEAIREAALRSAALTRQLMAFSRQQSVEPRRIDLGEAAAASLRMLRPLIGEDVQLRFTAEPGLALVQIDPPQIDQVLVNLIVNARDAITGPGQIVVEVRNTTLDAEICSGRPGWTPGPHVLVAVSDDGRGMTADEADLVFEPFFTTKSQGQGTGLGLATVYGIARQNGGHVEVESEPGRGSRFSFYLPAAAAEAVAAAPDVPTAPAPSRGERILLVEDEPAMLEVTTEMLEELGYVVVPAPGPRQAIELARAAELPFALLVTDIVMPEMNGVDLARALRDSQPGLQCLFVSGYTPEVIAGRGLADDASALLSKPFSGEALARKVRELLDA